MIVWPTQKFKVMQRCTEVKREQQWQEILIIRICYIAAIIQWSIFGENDHSDPIQSEINVSILTPQMTFYRIPRHFWSILCPSDGVDTGRMAWVSLRRSRSWWWMGGWSISEVRMTHSESSNKWTICVSSVRNSGRFGILFCGINFVMHLIVISETIFKYSIQHWVSTQHGSMTPDCVMCDTTP